MNFRGSSVSSQQLQIPQISEKIKTFFVERENKSNNKNNENVRVEVESVQNAWNKSKKELEKVAFKHQKFSSFLDEISKPISDILKKESYLLSLIEDGKVLIQRICFVRDKIIELNYATEYEKLQTFRTHNLKEYAEAVKENSKFWDQKLDKESTQKMVDMRSAYNENKKKLEVLSSSFAELAKELIQLIDQDLHLILQELQLSEEERILSIKYSLQQLQASEITQNFKELTTYIQNVNARTDSSWFISTTEKITIQQLADISNFRKTATEKLL